jgi:hypothetical protein
LPVLARQPKPLRRTQPLPALNRYEIFGQKEAGQRLNSETSCFHETVLHALFEAEYLLGHITRYAIFGSSKEAVHPVA